MSVFAYSPNKLTPEEVTFFASIDAVAEREVERVVEDQVPEMGQKNKLVPLAEHRANQKAKRARKFFGNMAKDLFYLDLQDIVDSLRHAAETDLPECIEAYPEDDEDEEKMEHYDRSNAQYLLYRSQKFRGSDSDETRALMLNGEKVKEKLLEWVDDADAYDEPKRLYREYIEENFAKHLRFHQIAKKMELVDIFSQWGKGEFTYKTPLFTNQQDLDGFFEYFESFCLHKGYGHLNKDSGLKKVETTDDVKDRLDGVRESIEAREKACKKFKERLENYEAKLNKQIQKKSDRKNAAAEENVDAMESKRLQEIESARLSSIAALKQHEEFMATPQPYKLDEQAQTVWNQLSHFAGSGATVATNAKKLMQVFNDTVAEIDIRDKNMQEMGATLFSASNMIAAARAFGADSPFKNATGGGSAGGVPQLRRLYASSEKVHDFVDKLLSNEIGILLLATLTRGPERSKSHAITLLDGHRQLADIDRKITAFEEEIKEFTPEEQAELRGDKDYKTLLEQREAKHKNLGLDTLRQSLAGEIHQAFQGISNRKISSAAVPVAVIAKKAGIELPESWLTKMNGEFHPALSPEGDRYVQIHSNEFPYKYINIKRSIGDNALARELQTLRSECEQHRVNMEMAHDFSKTLGFQITSHNNRSVLKHKEYGIDVMLEGVELKQTEDLLKAKAQCQERKFQQCTMLEAAKRAGIEIEGIDAEFHAKGAITLSHEIFGSITLAPRGYLSADDFTTVQNLLAQVLKKQQLPNVAPLDADTVAPIEVQVKKWHPETGQTLMIFDANTLAKLAARRGENGHTWLDIIKCTARLPNVKVVIPAVVIWELQGKIPVYDDQGHRTGFDQVDKRFGDPTNALGHTAAALDKLLKSASRASIETDCTVSFEAGASPNIIIMDTQGDKELYSRISDIMRSPPEERITRFQNEIHGKGEGEKAINRILKDLPFKIPAMIVSDDAAYFKNDAPLTSGQGMPVGQTGTGCYLDAELRAREPILRQLLKEQEPLSVYRIGEEINAFWEKHHPDDYYYLNGHSKRGQYAEAVAGQEPEHIYDLIKNGCSQLKTNGIYKDSGDGEHPAPGNGNRWARPNLRNEVAESLITPADVHDRPDQGAARTVNG